MNVKVLLGILLVVFGLGFGVIEWVRSGLAGPYPMIGLAASAIGVYLIVDGIRKKRTQQITGGDIIPLAGIMAGMIAGTLLIDELRKRQSKLSNQEILELERMLEEARIQGKVTTQKYIELKTELENIKRKRGIK